MGRTRAPDPRQKPRHETSDVERPNRDKADRKSRAGQEQYPENEGLAPENARETADPLDTTDAGQLEEAAAQRGRTG